MARKSSVVLGGVLRADGTLELDGQPELPPGRVRVKLQAVAHAERKGLPVPDPPWVDESIAAPFDLPLSQSTEPLDVRQVAELLPEPFEWPEVDVRP